MASRGATVQDKSSSCARKTAYPGMWGVIQCLCCDLMHGSHCNDDSLVVHRFGFCWYCTIDIGPVVDRLCIVTSLLCLTSYWETALIDHWPVETLLCPGHFIDTSKVSIQETYVQHSPYVWTCLIWIM